MFNQILSLSLASEIHTRYDVKMINVINLFMVVFKGLLVFKVQLNDY